MKTAARKNRSHTSILQRMAMIAASLALAFGPGRALASRPLGVDVSSYQGSGVNWTSVKNSGRTFAWAKATEGTSTDGDFTINQNNGKAAGVFMGAYDFAHPEGNSPGTESGHFWSVAGGYIKADGKTLMPTLDFEVFSGHVGASSFSDWANQWGNAIVTDANAANVTVNPVIYTSACSGCNFNSSVASLIPWIADYNGQNAQTGTPWSVCGSCAVWGSGVWDAWQYSSTTSVPGISGNCDVDVFNGTSASLVTTLVATAPATTTLNINVFYAGTDNTLWTEYYNKGWGLADLTGTTNITPGATPCATTSPGIVSSYYRGTDGHLYCKFAVNNIWYGPESIGGDLALGSNPVGFVPPNGRTSLFYRGNDAQLYIIQWSGSAWGAPIALGGSIATNTSPSYILHDDGNFNIFYHGSDGQLYTIYWYNGWAGPAALGGTMATNSSPTSVNDDGVGRIDIFYPGSAGQLMVKYWSGNVWSGPSSLGGTNSSAVTGNPTAINYPNSNINCFYRGSDGQLYVIAWVSNVWDPPIALGGTMDPNTNPTSEVLSSGTSDCYYRGTDGALWDKYWDGINHVWAGPIKLGGNPGGSPYAIAHD